MSNPVRVSAGLGSREQLRNQLFVINKNKTFIQMGYILLFENWRKVFENDGIGYVQLVTKYKDSFKGLVDTITQATQDSSAQEVLAKANTPEATPQDKAAADKIMAPVHASVDGLLERMVVDNKMSKGAVILDLYNKLDSGLMSAITTIMKPFVKDAAVDQATVNSIVKYLSEKPELKAIPLESKPGKPVTDASGQPTTVNGGTLIGSVINEIITKLGMVRA